VLAYTLTIIILSTILHSLISAPHFTHATTKVKEEIWDLFMMQYRIWPITNWLSFTYVPENLRVLTSNLISVFWNAYLCSKIAG
jgi:hypothetical protein